DRKDFKHYSGADLPPRAQDPGKTAPAAFGIDTNFQANPAFLWKMSNCAKVGKIVLTKSGGCGIITEPQVSGMRNSTVSSQKSQKTLDKREKCDIIENITKR